MKNLLHYVSILFFWGTTFAYGVSIDNQGANQIKPIANLNLTKKEKKFLKAHPTITAHNEADYPPYNFSEDGKPKGFSIDYNAPHFSDQ